MMREGTALFDSLYLQYRPMVLQMCLGFTKGDAAKALDITQEVFVNVWLALEGFKGDASHKTWLYRITVNTCLQWLRSDQRREQRHERFWTMNTNTTVSDDHTDLYRAIGQLQELDRLIITMVLDEVDYPEIAAVIGIEEGNLRVRIHRIKNKLKELMTHE